MSEKCLASMAAVFLMTPALVIAQPSLSVEGGPLVDWGAIKPGFAEANVVVKNMGTADLVISNVYPGCDCTTAPIDDDSLSPGESTTIRVKVDFTRSHGPQLKPLEVISNDPSAPRTMIHLKAEVEQDIKAEPKSFPYYSMTSILREFTTSVTISNLRDVAYTLEPPQLAGAVPANVRFEPAGQSVLQPGESMTLKVHVIPKAEGIQMANVIVKNSSPYSPELQIPLVYSAQDSADSK